MNSFIEILNQWGGNFLDFAWPMLWQSSLLIAGLFTVDLLFRRKLRASIRYALWLVVLVKLCVPPTLALPTSPAWWLHKTSPPVAAKPAPHYTVTYDDAPLPSYLAPPTLALPAPPPRLELAGWALAGAVAVSAGLLLWLAFRWWQVARMVGRAAYSENFSGLLDRSRWLAGLRAPVRLGLVESRMSPAVCGLFRPVILLPRTLAQNLSAAQLRAVLLHEMFHLRRHDLWLNCAQALLQIVYWWHPLLWIANARIRRVREEAVDDAVMLALCEEADDYAPTLLAVARLALNRPLVSLGLVGIMESRHALRQRIERLVDFRPPRRAGLTLVSLIGILAFSAIAVPMGDGPSPAEKQTVAAPAVSIPLVEKQKWNPLSVLITASIYQMNAADFEKSIAGLKLNPSRPGSDPWWSASPEKFKQFVGRLESSDLQLIQRPRIQTGSGMSAAFYAGDATNSVEFDCKPFAKDGFVDLTLQSTVISGRPANTFTNHFGTKASAEDHGGIVIRVVNYNGEAASNLLVAIRMEILTNAPPVKTGGNGQADSPTGTNAAGTGILTDPNFRVVLKALEQRNGSATLSEPQVVTTSGRAVNKIAMPSVSTPILTNKAGQLVQDGKLLYEMGKLDEAEVKLKAALMLDSDNATAKYYLGLVQSARKDPEPEIIKPARPVIVEKLDRIRFDQFGPIDGMSLSEVMGKLVMASGIAMSIEDSSIVNAPINLPWPLYNISLPKALDAVVQYAGKPINYFIVNGQVAFSIKDQPPVLFMRAFAVNSNLFPAALRNSAGMRTSSVPAMARSMFNKLGVDWESPKGKTVFYEDRSGRLFVKATASDLEVIEHAISALNQIAPQIHIKARFLEVPKGTLAGLKNIISVTNPPAGSNQVAGLVGILTDKNFRTMLHNLEANPGAETLAEPEVVTTSERQTQMRATHVVSIITNFVFEEIVTNVNSVLVTNNAITPKLQQIESGPIVDVVPNVLVDGTRIDLGTTAQVVEFWGYAFIPTNAPLHSVTNSAGEQIDLPLIWPAMQISRATADVSLHDGETLLMALNPPEQIRFAEPDEKREAVVAKHIRDGQKKNKGGERETIVFITATLVDPAGNRIHPER